MPQANAASHRDGRHRRRALRGSLPTEHDRIIALDAKRTNLLSTTTLNPIRQIMDTHTSTAGTWPVCVSPIEKLALVESYGSCRSHQPRADAPAQAFDLLELCGPIWKPALPAQESRRGMYPALDYPGTPDCARGRLCFHPPETARSSSASGSDPTLFHKGETTCLRF